MRVTGGNHKRLRCAGALAAVALLGGCGEDNDKIDLAAMQKQIKSEYSHELSAKLRKAGDGETANVTRVKCVKKTASEAKCFATVTGDRTGRVGIEVTISEGGDDFVYQADPYDIALTAGAEPEAGINSIEVPDDVGGDGGSGDQPKIVGQLVLSAVGGGDAAGIAVIAERHSKQQLIVQAELPRSKDRQAYEVWLYNNQGDALSLGAQVTDQKGKYQGAGPLPADYKSKYRYIDVSREKVDQGRGHSGQSVLRGKLSELTTPP